MGILQNLQERALRKETSRVIGAIKEQREGQCHHNDIGVQCDAECLAGRVSLGKLKPTLLPRLYGAVKRYVDNEGLPLNISFEPGATAIVWQHIPATR